MRIIFCLAITFLFTFYAAVAQTTEYRVGYKERGLASFYGQELNGKTLASGDKYDMFSMTAAHPALPFNTIVKVTNLANGKWVTLRVNDRGPFTKTRVLDVSKRAALKLDMMRDGETEVEVEVLKLGDNQMAAQSRRTDDSLLKLNEQNEAVASKPAKEPTSSQPASDASTSPQRTPTSTPEAAPPTTGEKTVAKREPAKPATPQTTASTSTKPAAPTKPATAPQVPLNKRFEKVGTYNVWGTPVKMNGFGIQLGTFNEIEKALTVANEARDLGLTQVVVQSGWTDGAQSFRVLFGSAPEREGLTGQLEKARQKGFSGAFIRKHL